MKNLKSFEQFVNESVNEAAKFNAREVEGNSFYDILKDYEDDPDMAEENGVNLDAFKNQIDLITKALGGNAKNVIFGDFENNDYDFYNFMTIVHHGEHSFGKGANFPSTKVIKTFNVSSIWREDDNNVQVTIVEIPGVAKYATWYDGDDFSDFGNAAFKKSDLSKIVKWVNDNYIEQ